MNLKNNIYGLVLSTLVTGCVKVSTYYNAPEANGYDVAILDYTTYVQFNIVDLDKKGKYDGTLNATFPIDNTLKGLYNLEVRATKGSPLEKITIDSVRNMYYKLKEK